VDPPGRTPPCGRPAAVGPITEALDRVQKYVASTTLTEPPAWQNSTLLKGDAADAVRRLKEELQENLVVFGSGVLVRSLLRRLTQRDSLI
jgi:dihydrofolate reductase